MIGVPSAASSLVNRSLPTPVLTDRSEEHGCPTYGPKPRPLRDDSILLPEQRERKSRG